MADKKKMSVADMLAAARKTDGGGEDAAPPESPPAEEAAAPVAEEKNVAEEKPAAPKAAAGARPSVADMLKMARGGDAAGAKKAPEEKKPAPKPTAKASPKPAAKAKPGAKGKSAPAAPMDTSSILAAARKKDQPGPITKAEAAAQRDKSPAGKAKAKPKLSVPPMPTRPALATAKKKKSSADEDRRGVLSMMFGTALGLGFSSLAVTNGIWGLATARFMYPNVLIEPPSRFKVGFPADFPAGMVETKFKAQFGVWVVNGEYQGMRQIYALQSVCTHLGCTPNWLDAERKFKCPCHGSGFYMDGVNFEGPAPRPLERFAIRLADDGQLEIDKSKKFQEEMGQWNDPASFVKT